MEINFLICIKIVSDPWGMVWYVSNIHSQMTFTFIRLTIKQIMLENV